MKTDKLTKSLLAAIAIALWMIAMNPWLRPTPVAAQEKVDLSQVESSLSSIESEVSSMGNDLGRMQRGTCTNSKVC
jgi:hypothetical protein